MKETEQKKLINQAKASVERILSRYSNSKDEKLQKKAILLAYWLKDYTNMIKKEETFKPHFLKKYKRGDIIQVHLGFNVGREEGGLHYAVVVSNINTPASDILTIIPLTSKKKNSKITSFDLDLGTTLFDQMKAKFDSAERNIRAELAHYANEYKKIEKKFLISHINTDQNTEEKLLEELPKIMGYLKDMDELNSELETITKIQDEIAHMKSGSIALVGQITTISKIRIYNPKNKSESLHGIKLSPKELDLIDQKIKELYTKN